MSYLPRPLNAYLLVISLLDMKPCYEQYAICSLSDNSLRYRANAYTLRGISTKDRSYRVRSLKRSALKSSFLGSLEAEGRKWLIFDDNDIRDDNQEGIEQNCDLLWRNPSEYEQMFPMLDTRELLLSFQPLSLDGN